MALADKARLGDQRERTPSPWKIVRPLGVREASRDRSVSRRRVPADFEQTPERSSDVPRHVEGGGA